MHASEKKLLSKTGLVVDLILTVLFFVLMTPVLKTHVPLDEAPVSVQWAFAVFAGIALSALFWMAATLLRVTWVDWKAPE